MTYLKTMSHDVSNRITSNIFSMPDFIANFTFFIVIAMEQISIFEELKANFTLPRMWSDHQLIGSKTPGPDFDNAYDSEINHIVRNSDKTTE